MSKPKRYGSRGTLLTDNTNKYVSQTGSGSSSRRTSWGDVLSKKWENRMTSDPDSAEAHNIDAIRKGIILKKLGVTSQAKMNRLKQALTHPYGSDRDISYEKARTYDNVMDDQWEERHRRFIQKDRH